MIQKDFADKASQILSTDEEVIGLAVAGSWLTNNLDEYSDLDLILVTKNKVAGDTMAMRAYASRLGDFLSGFTGEHVGEPRVLICLYESPLLHVDIKFLTLDEFGHGVETPALLLDKEGQLAKALEGGQPATEGPDYTWIENRFWTWVHYALLKIGRGELLEAYDFFGFLRMTVFGPLLQAKQGLPPRGVRKVETALPPADFEQLKGTIPEYNAASLFRSLRSAVALYRALRTELFPKDIFLYERAEKSVMQYFDEIEEKYKTSIS